MKKWSRFDWMAFFGELDTIWLIRFAKKIAFSYDHQYHRFFRDDYYNARANEALSNFVREIKNIEIDMELEREGFTNKDMDRKEWYNYYMGFAKIYKTKYIKLLGSDGEEALKAYTVYEHYKGLAENCLQSLHLNTTYNGTERT